MSTDVEEEDIVLATLLFHRREKAVKVSLVHWPSTDHATVAAAGIRIQSPSTHSLMLLHHGRFVDTLSGFYSPPAFSRESAVSVHPRIDQHVADSRQGLVSCGMTHARIRHPSSRNSHAVSPSGFEGSTQPTFFGGREHVGQLCELSCFLCHCYKLLPTIYSFLFATLYYSSLLTLTKIPSLICQTSSFLRAALDFDYNSSQCVSCEFAHQSDGATTDRWFYRSTSPLEKDLPNDNYPARVSYYRDPVVNGSDPARVSYYRRPPSSGRSYRSGSYTSSSGRTKRSGTSSSRDYYVRSHKSQGSQ